MAKTRPVVEAEADANRADADTHVRSIFKTLTTVLQICGLYIPRYRKGVSRSFHWLYSITVLTGLWANAVRIGILFKSTTGLSESLTTTSSLFVMFLGVAYVSTVTLIRTSQTFGKLLDTMNYYHRKHGFAYKKSRLSKVITISCIFGLVPSITLSVAKLYICGIPGGNLRIYIFPVDVLSGEHAMFMKIIIGLSTAFAIYNLYIMVVVFGSVCYCLSKEFGKLNNNMRNFLDDKKADLEDMRQHHSDICHILTEANGILSHILFTIFAVSLPLSCLLLYGAIAGSLGKAETMLILTTAASFVLIMFGMIIAAAVLNTQAHGSLEDIMSCKLNDINRKTVQTISVFIARLTGPPIGFHVYGLFTIDTSTILTIFGTLLTYAVVLLQFASQD